MENAVALCFRLELGVAAPARGFTHVVPPRRLPLAATNSRPKQVQKAKWCLVSGKIKFVGIISIRMEESSGDVRQILCMILEGRT